MAETVLVSLPVSTEVAELLRDDEVRAARAGKLLGDMLLPANAAVDPLVKLIAELKREAHAAGLTDEIIDAELAAHRAERRLRR